MAVITDSVQVTAEVKTSGVVKDCYLLKPAVTREGHIIIIRATHKCCIIKAVFAAAEVKSINQLSPVSSPHTT